MTHKFGIKVQILVKWEYEIKDETTTNFFWNSITKYILKVKVDYVEKEDTLEQIRSGEAKG